MKTQREINTIIVIISAILFIFCVGYAERPIDEKKVKEDIVYTKNVIPEDIDINHKARYEIKTATITVYTPYSDGGKWGYKTATGATSQHLATCAVDPTVIPLGSKVIVNGLELTAVDTGSKVKGNIVDIFYNGTEEEAKEFIKNFGVTHSVYYY